MPKGSNPIKVQQWTKRLERFARSGQTVVQFCQDERVSQPSFYHWKKRLVDQTSPTPASSKSSRSAFRAVEVTSSSCLAATTIRLASGIEIELGDDLRVVQAVVKQVLDLPTGTTLSGGGRSC